MNIMKHVYMLIIDAIYKKYISIFILLYSLRKYKYIHYYYSYYPLKEHNKTLALSITLHLPKRLTCNNSLILTVKV